MPAVQTLAPGEGAPGRPFADPANTLQDLAALSDMHRALRLRVRSHPSGGRWSDAGADHWLVVVLLSARAGKRRGHRASHQIPG